MDAYEKVVNARSKDRSISKEIIENLFDDYFYVCLLYTSPSPRD